MTERRYSNMVWDVETVRRFWDYQSQYPQTYYSFLYGEQILNRVIEILRIDPRKTIWLDYGCGVGNFTALLLKKGFKTVIWDQSENSLEICMSKFKNESNFLGVLGEKPEKINIVSLIEVIEHIEFSVLKSVIELLKGKCHQGTKIVLTTPNEEDLNAHELQEYCPQCNTIRHRWQHIRSFSKSQLAKELIELEIQNPRIFGEDFEKGKYFRSTDVLRKIKRRLFDYRHFLGRKKPNLLAIGEF